MASVVMNKTILSCAAFLGLLAVVLGALGAHALKEVLSADSLESYRTGVSYQMFHALFLLFLGSTTYLEEKFKKAIFLFVLFGILLFSFSIYGLTIGPLAGIDFSVVGWVTPLGGLLLISAWGLLLYRVIRPLG